MFWCHRCGFCRLYMFFTYLQAKCHLVQLYWRGRRHLYMRESLSGIERRLFSVTTVSFCKVSASDPNEDLSTIHSQRLNILFISPFFKKVLIYHFISVLLWMYSKTVNSNLCTLLVYISYSRFGSKGLVVELSVCV